MTDNASEIDVTARSTIGKTTASNQISSRAKKLGQLVEKGLSGLGENQINGFLKDALLEIEGSLSDFEKDYDGKLLRLERLLSSRKGKVTKALSAGLVKVQYGKGQDYYAVDYAQMYNAFFEKVLKIVKATKSQGSSAILGQIQEHIHEMIGNDSLTDDDKALMNKLIQEMQALQKERAKIKVVEVGKPPEQKVTVEVKQEITPVTQEQVVAAVKEKQAAGTPIAESASLHTATIKKLEADVARLQKEMEDADKEAAALFDAMDAGDTTVSQSVADAAEEDYQKKLFLWKKAQQDLENEKDALKREGIGGKQQLTAEEVAEFRKKQKDATGEATTTPRSKPDKRPSKQPRSGGGKQAPSEDDADYVKSARERIKVLDDAYDQFLGMQSMWMSGIEQSITDMLDGVRLASQEMVFVITAEIQKNIGGKLKTIGKQIEESFGAKSTSGVASIAGKLDTINTTLLEIKNGLIRQKYMQDVRSVPKSIEDEAPQKAIAEMIGNALNQELAPLLGEVLGETSEYNWQKWLTLEGDVRKPFIDKFIGLNKGGIVPGTGTSDSVPALLTPGEWVINPRRLDSGTIDWEAVKARRDFALRIRNEPIEHLGIFTSDSPYDVIEAIGDQTSVMQTEEQIEAIKRSGGRWSAIHNHPTEYHGFQTVFPSHGDINAMTGGLYRGAIGAERFSIVSGDVLSSIVAPASWDERQEQHRTDWLKYRYNAEWKDAEPLLNFSIHSYLRNKVLSERGVTESIRELPLFDYPKDTPELQRAFYYTLIQHKLKGFYGSIFNPESLRFLAGGTFDFAYEADAALKATSLSRKYKPESIYLNSLVADRSVALAKDLLLQPMDKVIAYDTFSNIAGAIGSFNRPTLTDSVLPIRGADRGSGWNMYVGELAALERGKGLGPTLIGMALAKALKGPVGDLLTHIELKAIPFKDTIASYLKMGFVPVGEQHPGEPLIPMAANIRDFLSSPKVSPDVRLALPKKGIMSREHPALKDFSLTAFPYEVIDPVTAAGTIVPAGTRTPNIFKYLANGGPLMPGQTAVVGEEGPEMLVPAGSGFHVLNNKIFRAIGGMRFLKKGTVKADQEPDLDWQGMKWSPDYVTGMSEGLAFVTGNALKEAIRADVGPEFRTAAGGFTKSLNASLVDIVTGRSINAPETPIDPVKQMKLDTGKLGMQFERLISSTRYAVTGGLIFAHVLRMLTATSQVYQKSMGAVGRGWGYMLDMVVRPLLPAFLLITRGFIWLGNFFKGHKLIALGTGLALVGVAVFAALYSIYKMKKDVEAAAAAFEKLTAALNGTPYTPPEQGPGILSRIWGGAKAAGGKVRDWWNAPIVKRKKAAGGYRIPGYGGGDSVGILAEPGELVVPKEVVRGFEHRAAGGVAGSGGDFGSWMGGVIGGAGDIFKGGITTIAQGVGAFLSSDIGKSIVGGLGVASKMIGAVMAPIAGVGIAIGAIKGGMHGLGRIFVKGQQAQVETSIAVGKAQRNLLSMISLEGMGILAVVVGIAAILDKYLKGEEIPTIGFAGGLNIWDLITGAAKSIWDFIKTPLKSVWEFLKGVAKSVWEFIKGGLKSLWDFVKPVLKSVWEFVKPVFKSVWEFVKGGLKSIWEFVKPVLKPIWDYVKAGVKDVWDFIKTPVKSIWDFITGGKTNEPKPTPEGTGWKSAGIKGGVITSALVAIDEVINKKRPLGEALPDIATGGLIGVAAGAITAATGGLTGGPLAALGHDWAVGFGSRTGGTIADALGLDKEGKKIAEDIGGMGMSVVNDSLGWAATGAMVGGVVAGPPGAAVGAGVGAIAGPVIGMFQDLFKIKEEVDKLTSGVNLTPEQANAGGHLTNQYGLIGSAVATAYNVGVDLQGLPAAAAGAVTGGIDAGAKAIESALKTAGDLLTTAVDTVKGVVDGVLNTVKEWQDAAAQAGAGVRETILGAFESLGEYLSGLPSAIMNLIDKYMSGLPVIGALWNSAKGAIGIPSMAVGGDILSDGLVYAHSGETIVPARVNTNTSTRSTTQSAAITNHNTFVIQREDDRVLFQKFQQMMVSEQRRLVI